MNEIIEVFEELKQALLEMDDAAFEVAEGELLEAINDTIHYLFNENTMTTSLEELKQTKMTEYEALQERDNLKAVLRTLSNNVRLELINEKKMNVINILENNFNLFADQLFDNYIKTLHTVKVHKLLPTAVIPTYAHPGDQGADIYAAEEVTIPPHGYSVPVRTGLSFEIPEGWAIAIRQRSGLSKKTGLRLSNTPATIDTGYRGEIGLIFDNVSDQPITIHVGDRVAQFILEKNYQASFCEIETPVDASTERGEGGFGSSGI